VKLSPITPIIAPEKLRDYALNPANPDGESKARFFGEMGYNQEDWQILEADLREQHLSQEAKPGKTSMYGEKHEIIAPLVGPNKQERWLRSIWMVRKEETVARFITLIPEKQP
jgi:hypothetical protein